MATRIPTPRGSLHPLPTVVLHADWSIHAAKRRCAIARLQDDGLYALGPPGGAPDPAALLPSLLDEAGEDGWAFAGFDFAIGLPEAYARRIGCTRFLDLLPLLGRDRWARFYDPAEGADEIAPERPFYPARNGPKGTQKQKHLTSALGVASMDELLRPCDRRTRTRDRNAQAIFWTLGPNQVGKAVIVGWRDMLGPALRSPLRQRIALWPFDGPLETLVGPNRVVIAEAYPADFYAQLGFRVRSKTSRAERQRAIADGLWPAIERLGILVPPALRALLDEGCGDRPETEDDFDAIVGLVGMLNIVLGHRPPGDPMAIASREVEGWILGLAP